MIGGTPLVVSGLPFAGRSLRPAALRVIAIGVLLVAGLVAPAAARAAATTLYVDEHDPSCLDAGAGTAAQPFCTIGAAAANTAPGTTVVIASGTYAEAVKPPASGTPGNPITYTAAPGANVVMAGWRVSGLSWVTIKGFTINIPGTASASGISATESSNVAVVDNEVSCTRISNQYSLYGVDIDSSSRVAVTGNRTAGCGLGIHVAYSTDSDVDDNTSEHDVFGIEFNRVTGTRIAGNAVASAGYGIQINHSDDTTIADNSVRATAKGIDDEVSSNTVILNNAVVNGESASAGPLYAIQVGGDGGYPDSSPTGTQIVSNSIAQYGPADAISIQGQPTIVANNVIDAFNSSGGAAIHVDSYSAANGARIDYDVLNAADGKLVFWNGWSYSSLAKLTAAAGQEAHGIQHAAGFTDPANGNLSLTPGSPAVDSAFAGTLSTPAWSLPAADAWGSARIDDAAIPNTGTGTISYADRGAYEMHNPGFEANTAGWNTSGGSPGVTLHQTAGGHTGNGAALVTNTAATPATCTLNDSPNIVRTTTAGTYTATVWVRADSPGATLTLRLREWADDTAVGQTKTLVSLTDQWEPVTVHYTAVDPGASTLDLNAYVMNAAPGTCFSADDASVAVG